MRIAIVNDLALAREALRRAVVSAGHEVAWQAADGAEAVHRAMADRPDVLLMDLVMPVLDGAEATRQIMIQSPCDVLVVTSSVGTNHRLVCEALGAGGLDAVTPPTLGTDGVLQHAEPLLHRLSLLERARKYKSQVGPLSHPGLGPPVAPATVPPLVLLGASTGGPEALARVLEALPASFPAPVVIAQHIGLEFIGNLVSWLQGRCALRVSTAREGDQPQMGTVALASTEDHLILRPCRSFHYTPQPADYPFRPSVNALFESAARHWPTAGAAAVLTGMGSDGARGLLALRQAGWLTLAQDAASCVVYGMPKAAAEAANRVLPPREIGLAIAANVGKKN